MIFRSSCRELIFVNWTAPGRGSSTARPLSEPISAVSDSALIGQLKVKDVIAAVDGANTTRFSATDLVGLISRNEHAERVLTVHRKAPRA